MSDDPYDYTSPLMKTVPAKGRRGAPDDTVTIPRPQYEALMAALEATRLLEAAEHFHANCEECEGEGEMEECGECFPLADDARLKRREAIMKAHSAGLIDDADLRAAGIEIGEGK